MSLSLKIVKSDPEHIVGIYPGRFTKPNSIVSLFLAIIFTFSFYLIIQMFDIVPLKNLFIKRGVIPYFIVVFTSWSVSLLLIKKLKIKAQSKALRLELFSNSKTNIISEETVDDLMNSVFEIADKPREYILLNRILVSLTNFKNLRQVGDVDTILRAQAEIDEDNSESSFTLVRGFLWAIPILGFVGTVLGLSEAIGSFAPILSNLNGGDSAMEELRNGLKSVVGGLSTAFDTTLESLIGALIVNFFLTSVKRSEEEFLDQCREYCQLHIISRLRLSQRKIN